MKNFKLFFTAFLLFITQFVSAQLVNEKTVVAVYGFTYSSSQEDQPYAEELSNFIFSNLSSDQRFKIINKTNDQSLAKPFQLGENQEHQIDLYKKIGQESQAEFLITGYLSSTSTRKSTKLDLADISTGYFGKVVYNLFIIKAKTGQIVFSEQIESSGPVFSNKHDTQKGAILNAITSSKKKLNIIWKKSFPIHFRIYEVTKENAKKIQEVSITGGNYFNLRNGKYLLVVEEKEIEYNGIITIRQIPVTKIRVKQVLDLNFSTCTVSDGKILKEKLAQKVDLKVLLEF